MRGCQELAEFLRSCDSIVTLNVGYNDLTDEGVWAILEAVTPPNPEFLDDAVEVDYRHNASITALNVSATGMGHIAAEGMLDTFRGNKTLSTYTRIRVSNMYEYEV